MKIRKMQYPVHIDIGILSFVTIEDWNAKKIDNNGNVEKKKTQKFIRLGPNIL